MKRIGLTGGIGSGKSTVAEIFSRLGIPVFISDEVARDLQENDADLVREIREIFGKEIYNGRKLDRQKLAGIVFSDKQKLQKLNSVVHPAVGKAFEKFCMENSGAAYVLKESAILYEIGDEKNLDGMIVVTAPEDIRKKRVTLRDGIPEEEVEQRMKNQFSQEEKTKLADFVLVNDEQQLLIPQVLKINETLQKPD
jgi:dephospho-CoA kinase